MKQNKRHIFTSLIFSALSGVAFAVGAAKGDKPNVVYILVDDMGYGDVSALNPESKVPTPNIDRLACEGMTFTDAHTSSSVCTPTRYNVLTGRYNWRTSLKKGVLNGYGAALISEDRLTLASLCQSNGYQTAMIGKWHLGMNLPMRKKQPGESKLKGGNKYVDWSKPIKRTPTSNGFDYFWGHGASLDFPPYVYIENNHYTSQNVRFIDKKTIRNELNIKSYFREGWIADNFDHYRTMDEFCDRAAEYIRNADPAKPFCLYVPLTSPHTPIIPTSEWKGKSGLSAYGDFCMQTDAGVGRIMQALKDKGVVENTIVVFTADNGCSPAADIESMHKKGHRPNHIYRGHKADIWDGGHRVPHIIRWPKTIKAGSETDRLTVLGDIVATMADVLDFEIPDDAAEDSVSFYQALQGKNVPAEQHEAIVHHSASGQFAIRSDEWKLIFCPGSGGWSKPKDREARKKGLPEYQLYNMKNDPQETTNLINEYPELVGQLTQTMTRFVEEGRSTPGALQKNDTENNWAQLVWFDE